MISLVGWLATIATMIAAMMTASNLGARVTGWGFVVFSISSVTGPHWATPQDRQPWLPPMDS